MKKFRRKLLGISVACAMVIPAAALSGCGFFGDSSGDGSGGSKPSGSKTKTYTITYTVGGTEFKLDVEPDMPYKLTGVPFKEGFGFVGLFDEETGGTMYVDETGKSVGDFTDGKNIKLYSRFLPKITFDENGGTDVDDAVSDAGYAVTLPGTTMENAEFIGWFRADDGTEYTGGAMPDKGFTVKAKWQKKQNITKAITSGTSSVKSSKTGILYTIDMSEYFESDEKTSIVFSVSYDLKVNSYTNFLVTPPKWFDFMFYSSNTVNSAYKIGEAVCTWTGEYGNVPNETFTATLDGNKIYIAADSNTWAPGFTISNFIVKMSFTDIIF